MQNNRARWRVSLTGRWTSEDPLGLAAGDPNLYRYAGGKYANQTDPVGGDGSIPPTVLSPRFAPVGRASG